MPPPPVIYTQPSTPSWLLMDSYVCYGVWPLALPSAIHCLTATTPALTVTLSANGDGSALVGRVFGFGGVGLVISST
jgi:hypothetical protein